MKYKILNKEISGPFTIPSGIVTTEVSILEKIANEIPEIGILTTKSIGIEPREGNKEPIVAQYAPFSFINAVGLRNPGAEEFARKISKIKIPKNKFLLISIFGKNEKEFQEIGEKLVDFADGFELNLSCPHSERYGQVIGSDFQLVEKIVKRIVSLGKPVFAKISPNLDIKKTIKAILKGGVSGIAAINTKGPELYLYDNYPVLSNKVGGVSGKAILELGIQAIKKVRELTNLPIIASGGIFNAKDLRKYKKAGANFFGVGSALAGMSSDEIRKYFHQLLIDLEKGGNKAISFLKERLNSDYKKYKIKEKKFLAKDLFLLRLNNKIETKPGQFIFAWLPEKGEKPFSIFDDDPLTLLIQKRGYFTTELSKLKENDFIYIRGPYGKSPEIKGRTLLVGGGTGMAALYLFAKRNKEVISLLGAKDRNHLAYLKKFKAFSEEVYLVTESGDLGDKGLVTDKLEKIIKMTQPEYCLNCGPETMIRKAIEIESKFLPQEKIYSSIEYLTRCGIGLCGSCATSKGYRNCVDGTFLRNSQIY